MDFKKIFYIYIYIYIYMYITEVLSPIKAVETAKECKTMYKFIVKK